MAVIIILALLVGCLIWLRAAKKPRYSVTITHSTHDTSNLDSPQWDTAAEYAPSDPKPVAALLLLTYRDGNGQGTERQVQVRECDTLNPAGYLTGICQLRGAFRTFRIDRVERAVDMETGEIIENIPAWAQTRYLESPAYAIEQLLSTAADAMRALLYIGKADGRFTKKEKEIFLTYCQAKSGATHITQADLDRACAALPLPSMQSFKLICGRLAKLPQSERTAVLEACEQMVATEKKIAPEEAAALDYMRKRLTTGTEAP